MVLEVKRMTNVEAIGFLEGLYHFADDVECAALNMAIEALEKQIPKKVIDHDYCIAEYDDSGCQIGGIFLCRYECPTCNNTIANGELEKSDLWDIRFCQNCGQAIDWSEVEE